MISSSGINLSIVKGEPFNALVTADYIDNSPFDLTNYLVSGGIKYKYTEVNLVDFNISPLSLTSGIVNISLLSGQTNLLPVSECIYYLKAYPSGDAPIIDLLNRYADIFPL